MTPAKHAIYNQKAFTMIEIIVALAIFSISFVSVMSHILATRRGAEATFEEMKGIAYAGDMIDRIKTTPYKNIPVLTKATDKDSFSKLGITKNEMAEVVKPYEREVTVTEIKEKFNKSGDSQSCGMKKVLVEVKWTVSTQDDKGQSLTRPVSIKLMTLIRKLVN